MWAKRGIGWGVLLALGACAEWGVGDRPLVPPPFDFDFGPGMVADAGLPCERRDDDGDGLSNPVEQCCGGFAGRDEDGDGTPDCEDLDSDDNGIPDRDDAWRFGGRPGDLDEDGTEDFRDDDDDGDGLSDVQEIGGDPSAPADTDRDGVPDFRDTDSDDDGLPDLREVELGTDARRPDSDDDGVNDFIEIALGTSPADPDDRPALPEGTVVLVPFRAPSFPERIRYDVRFFESLETELGTDRPEVRQVFVDDATDSASSRAFVASLEVVREPGCRPTVPDDPQGGFAAFPLGATGCFALVVEANRNLAPSEDAQVFTGEVRITAEGRVVETQPFVFVIPPMREPE